MHSDLSFITICVIISKNVKRHSMIGGLTSSSSTGKSLIGGFIECPISNSTVGGFISSPIEFQ